MSGSWRASRVGAQSKQHCWRKKRQLVDEADVEGHQEAVKSIYQTRDHSGVSTELILRKQQNDNSRQDSNHLTRTTAAAATTTTSGAQMRPSARLNDNNDSAQTTDVETRRRRTTIGCRRPVNTNLLGALVALLVLVNLANLIGLGQVSCSPQVFRSSSSSSTSANQQAAPSAVYLAALYLAEAYLAEVYLAKPMGKFWSQHNGRQLCWLQNSSWPRTPAERSFGCPYPAVSPNSQVNIVSQAPAVPLVSTEYVADEYATLKADTQASYKCDHGFELLGQETLTCLQSGRWSGSPPSCVTNIALGKPTNQSSTVKGGDSRNANDGRLTTQHDSKHCTETRVDQSPWWQIDLLQVYEIRSIRLLGRACCNPQLSLHDIEIRVGNSSSLQGNRLCAWYPNNLDEGVARDFQCANPIYGRFVSIQMVGIESALSLCEVMVFSTKEFPSDRCNIQATLAPSSASTRQSTQTTTTTSATTTQQSSLSGSPDSQINVFNRTCYEMQATQGGSFLVADTYCKARGGSLVHSVTDLTHSYISQELERMKSKLKSKLVWLGAKRENASPNAQGPITPGSTSALIGSDSILHHSLVSDRGLSMSLNEFPVEGLFAPERSLISPGEPSPIFSPLKLARTSLLQVSSGAGGSTSRGSQTFGLPTSGQHHPTNRTIEHTGRSLSIIQPNQVASFLTPPVPIQTATDRPAFASPPTSQPSSPSSPISFSGSSHVHRSLRPPSLVSSSSSSSSSSSGGSQRQEASAAAAAASTSWNTQIATAPSLSGGQSSSSSWRWTGDAASDSLMSPVTSFLWAEDQPNNYNNQQDCIVMDGAKKWLWNDVTCELDYLPWVCQYRPSTCGSPDRNENSTVLELPLVSSTQDNPSSSADPTFQLGKTITYACPVGHKLDGPRTRKCLYDGTWSGKAPRCQYINCGPVGSQTIDNGRVVYLNQSQTTYGSQVKYVCYEDYVLVGDDTRQCQGDGKWAGKQPFCAYKWCPVLQQISNGALNVSSYSENSIATYQCNSGYKLIGNDTRQCLLGGKWTNQEPFCQYVDCGQPKQIPNGSYQLLNGTNYLSVVEYTCNDNYTLVGNNNNRMICSHNNRWTGKEPQCELIDCGQPVANAGSRYVGDSFSVHSTVDYKCDPGFKEVSGSGQRTCGRDGQWTGQPLSCKYVDCGRVPAILKGEVSYINGTTYLASQVTYDCTPGNRLSGHRVRFCGPDARWTGSSPKCEEVRCEAPSLPANGSAVYIGNDRSFKEQSFSVGVTVKYECDYGHVVKGSWSSRLCQANGEWSGEPPVCKFVDCGLPPTIDNGNFVLKHPPPGATIGSAVPVEMLASRRSDNAASSASSAATTGGGAFTYYGTIAHYNCEPNFKLQGPGQRECLESGAWRTPLPTCEPVQCPRPEFFDEFTQVAMISRSVSQSLAEQISSSTSSGSSQSDHQELIALASKATKLIANNQWLVSQQESQMFGVGDKLYYSCVPGYELYGGPEIRTCTQYGQWSGSSTPRCRLIDCGRPSPIGQEGRFYLLNETTTFNSLVEYSCVRPFKLVEVKQRQAGNLIEILSNAQAGVTPILTSLPIGVKVCANNGQWMPNDQQPKCVSSADSAPTGGQFDGVDNTLDGSHRSVHVTSNTGIGSNQDGVGATADNNLEGSTGGFHNHQQAASTSLWAKVIIAFCLLIMLALIILTLICIRSGKKKPKQGGLNTQAQQVLHRSSMLTPPGHQAAAAVAAIQLQLANGKGMQQQQHQQQHPASHHQGAQMISGHQNIYLSSGMHKMFPGSMVGQSQMTSAALSGSVPVMNPYGDETGASPNLVLANGRSMAPIQQADMGAGNRQHNQSMMDNYSRLSIDSDQTSVANHHHHPANKTIRHNPNGLVTFVSPSQHQQQQQQTTRATSQHQVSPQSISTSLSVSSSSSPSSSSSAHHTTATRLSGTDSASSPSSGSANHNHHHHHHQQHLPAHHLQHHHHHLMAGGHLGQESEYQAPQQFIQQEVSPSQPSPPSLPAHPPPPHRVQQHHKQLMKHQQHSKAAQMAAVAATTTSTSPHGANDQSD